MGVDESKKEVLDVEATAPPPAYEQHHGQVQSYEQEGFWTRNGLTINAFKPRPAHHVELNRTMKTRHMHMIAIGGSIGMPVII